MCIHCIPRLNGGRLCCSEKGWTQDLPQMLVISIMSHNYIKLVKLHTIFSGDLRTGDPRNGDQVHRVFRAMLHLAVIV